ncbi:MAG: hypothetical protein WBV95_09625, partial [Desulfobacterales bacterium]
SAETSAAAGHRTGTHWSCPIESWHNVPPLSVLSLSSRTLSPAGITTSGGLSRPSAFAFSGSFSAGGRSGGISAVASAFTLALA